MKVIQFIHPLFLTALGLHAALLFVPIGGEAEPILVEEDVPLAELTREPTTLPDSSQLPVPDPNVSTGTAAKAAGSAVRRTMPSAKVPPVVTTGTTVAPTAMLVPNQKPSIAPNTGGSGTSTSNTVSTNRSNSSTDADTDTESATKLETDSDAENTANAGSSLPVLVGQTDDTPNETTNESVEVAANTDAANNNEEATIGTVVLSELMASASTDVSPEFESSTEDLVESLTYDATGTDNDTAEKRLATWKAELSQQASAGRIESIEPVLNSDNLMEYPLEAALSLNGRSLSVCLEEFPQTAEIGVVFDGQGELVGKPEIIRSTGYEALNEEAIALVTQPENLPLDRASKAYLFDVTVDYDEESCVSLEALQGTN